MSEGGHHEFRARVNSFLAINAEMRVDLSAYMPREIAGRIEDGAEVTVTVRVPPPKVGDVFTRAGEIRRCTVGTVLTDKDGDTWHLLCPDAWWVADGGSRASGHSAEAVLHWAPFTVAWLPKGDA